MIIEVLTKKPKLTMVDYGGYNCLMMAVKNQNKQAVKLLLGSIDK